MRADDLDDLASSITVSESRDDPLAMARNLERLSIQELEEEHRLNRDDTFAPRRHYSVTMPDSQGEDSRAADELPDGQDNEMEDEEYGDAKEQPLNPANQPARKPRKNDEEIIYDDEEDGGWG
jgi:hypothetical protein